ncbi:MAG: valine--tRNA ligase [Candidatus Micrarchaeota archaeon]|nr:valine--tRNA ligase [Candidatus Micrarchaeota archaeon]
MQKIEWSECHFTNEMEEKWESYWLENKIYKFDINSDKPVYSIDTPPPFTSGQLHMGHVLSYSYFDFAARYKRMKGYNVYYPQGWDTQGFPTETRVESLYGKKEPKEFLRLCHEWTEKCIQKMKQQMIRMGFSPDWDYEYKTLDKSYHKAIQKSLLMMYEKKDLYLGEHPVFYCWKCKSALAKTDTEDIEEKTYLNFIRFFGITKDGKRTELTVATTRPELLNACVALLYHPDDSRYNSNEFEHVETPLGRKVPLLPDPDVDKDFGSGLVMVCTFGDKQDVIWWHRHKLKYIEAFDENGYMLNSEVYETLDTNGNIQRTHIKIARQKMFDFLKSRNLLITQKELSHSVKIHDRCKTHVEFRISKQWFAKLIPYGKEIVDTAKKMRWYPEFSIAHLIDWVNTLEWDWVVSRQRIFGTPLPFWYCDKCGKTVPASYEELPVDPRTDKKNCQDCGALLRGETSVCDCWVDSSITPLIISKWHEKDENQEAKIFFEKTYPSTLRPQGLEIIRTWAFYTIYRCKLLTGVPCFNELLINGNVLAPDGKKMSKSLGNVIEPDELLKNYQADAIRQWAALSGAMAKDRPFSYEDIMFAKKFINKLWNASKFIYMKTNGEFIFKKVTIKTDFDAWILKRLSDLIKEVNASFDNYEYQKLIKAIHQFFWFEFCDFYIEGTKNRTDEELETTKVIYSIVLENVLRLLAPIAPHVTEEIYQRFKKVRSIHLLEYPNGKEVGNLISEYELDDNYFSVFKEVVEKTWSEKKQKNLKDINVLEVHAPESISRSLKELVSITRAKQIKFVKSNEKDVIKVFLS